MLGAALGRGPVALEGLALVACVCAWLACAPAARADIAWDPRWDHDHDVSCDTPWGPGRYDENGTCQPGIPDAGFLHVGGPPPPPHHEPAHVQVALPGWVYVGLGLAFVGGVAGMIALARRRPGA